MDSKTLKIVCLTAVLAAIMVAPRAANAMVALPYFHYDMYVNSTWEMYNSYVVFRSSGNPDEYLQLGSLVTRHLDVQLFNEPDSYYVVGVYDYDTGGNGAVVSFNDSTITDDWDDLFSDSEDAVISWCNDGYTKPLNSYTSLWTPITPYSPTPSYNGFLYGFSDPNPAGGIQIMKSPATAVPEASTLVGFVTAAMSFLGFRRFRK